MLTVLIAAYNGGKTLPAVLKAYRTIVPPHGGWQLVIVDNGSTDDTKEIIAAFRQCLPLTFLYEPTQGKNAALNTGLSCLSGDLVVLTDDDVLPRPVWLQHLRSAADSQPSFSLFGGPILPEWEYPPDDWILAWVPLGPTFAIVDSLEDGPINPRLIFGPNMTVRADIFQRGYLFDETIGPKGTNYPMGSEAEFLKRLASAGFKAWHCKKATVDHIIRAFQMKQEWVLARAARYGRGQYRLAAKSSPNSPMAVLGVPIPLLLRMLAHGLRLADAQLRGNAERLFKAWWHWNYLIGQATEARLLQKERARLEDSVEVGQA